MIDSYRLRVELDHIHRQEDHGIYYPGKWEDGIVWTKGDVVEDFQLYLGLAEAARILPKWWYMESRMECLSLAIDKKDEGNIFNQINQETLIQRYDGDTQVRNALCILAELVVGYDGKGAANDGDWYESFVEYLENSPEEKAKLLAGSVAAVRAAFEAHGRQLPGS